MTKPSKTKIQGLSIPTNIWEKLCSSELGEAHFLQPRPSTSSLRDSLASRYANSLVDRPDLRMLTTPASDKSKPILNWFFYKEAFSSELVEKLLEDSEAPLGALIVDPFSGVGTVPIACMNVGMNSIGFDYSPLPAFIARTKIGALKRNVGPELVQCHQALIAKMGSSITDTPSIDVSIWQKGFDRPVAAWLQAAVIATSDLRLEKQFEPLAVDLLHLAILSVAEEVSHTVKDGTSLRLRAPGRRLGRAGVTKTTDDVVFKLKARIDGMVSDMNHAHSLAPELCNRRDFVTATIAEGDAREFDESVPASSVDAVITSPPYVNRYDYSAIYTLELLLGFISNREELRDLRFKLLRSHLEAPWPEVIAPPHPAVSEVLSAFLSNGMSSNRVFKMVLGYFDDMRRVLQATANVLKPGGKAFFVVGNVRIEGEVIPVDLILADLALETNLQVIKILVTREKGTNSQQAKRFGASKLRESVVCLQKC